MRERPILFSAPMIRAIINGSKSQTRRVMKPQPVTVDSTGLPWQPRFIERLIENDIIRTDKTASGAQIVKRITCPYGQPGDRLWVRETFADLRGMGFGNDPRTDKPWNFAYRADVISGSYSDDIRKQYGVKWKPAIHMPRIASRITLEITGVRVERLQDITNNDTLDEGTPDLRTIENGWDMRRCFQDLWEQINGDGSWAENPWVWVIEFRRVTS